jgi:hypothetical protein
MMIRILAVVGCLLSILGCSHSSKLNYQGTDKPISEVAVLIPGFEQCRIEAVDYESVNLGQGQEIHLISGNHTIQVQYPAASNTPDSQQKQFATLQADFAPGRVYVLRVKHYTSDHPKLADRVLSELFIEKEGTLEQFVNFHGSELPDTPHWQALRQTVRGTATVASEPTVRAY